MDYDSPWKESMDRYFEWFMRFFFPRQDALIDWSRDSDSLDSELRKLSADAETGKRHVDKLIALHRLDSEDRRLAHVEFQMRKEVEFPHRLHVYNYRIEDVHHQPVWTLVLLADEDADWRPTEYRFEEEGCERTLKWPLVKLLDYGDKLDELAEGENLFGWLVVAQLVAQRTRNDAATRKEWKLRSQGCIRSSWRARTFGSGRDTSTGCWCCPKRTRRKSSPRCDSWRRRNPCRMSPVGSGWGISKGSVR